MTWRHGTCRRPPFGWFCTLDAGHKNACPTVARWWNAVGRMSSVGSRGWDGMNYWPGPAPSSTRQEPSDG